MTYTTVVVRRYPRQQKWRY